MDFVLCENDPMYTSPSEGESYCFKRGNIIFNGIEKAEWLIKRGVTFDLIEDIDYGNIDSFEYETGSFFLEGDWGEMVIHSKNEPTVQFAE